MGFTYIGVDEGSCHPIMYKHSDGYDTAAMRHAMPKYTRSRDALKSIRPSSFTQVHLWVNSAWHSGPDEVQKSKAVGFSVRTEGGYLESFSSSEVATEELAELHAIIQAIAFERKQQASGP